MDSEGGVPDNETISRSPRIQPHYRAWYHVPHLNKRKEKNNIDRVVQYKQDCEARHLPPTRPKLSHRAKPVNGQPPLPPPSVQSQIRHKYKSSTLCIVLCCDSNVKHQNDWNSMILVWFIFAVCWYRCCSAINAMIWTRGHYEHRCARRTRTRSTVVTSKHRYTLLASYALAQKGNGRLPSTRLTECTLDRQPNTIGTL